MASLWGLFAKSAVQFGVWPSWYAAVIEFVGGVLVLLGVGSRVAALICSGSMAYAYFVVHQSNALLPMSNGGEAAALFSWAFLLIAVLGPGPYALDALFKRRQQVTAAIEGVEG
jgi:putative oxidoreductase